MGTWWDGHRKQGTRIAAGEMGWGGGEWRMEREASRRHESRLAQVGDARAE